MSKKVKIGIISGIIAVILAIVTFASGFFIARDYYLTKEMQTLKFILDNYHKYYYYQEDDVSHLVANGILDDYSAYYTKEEYEIIEKASQGYKNTTGIAPTKDLEILKVLFNSPADLAGIKSGGKIVKVNSQPVASIQDFKQKAVGTYSLTINYNGTEVEYPNLKAKEFKETFVRFYDSNYEYSFLGIDSIALNKKSSIGLIEESIPSDTLYIKYTGFSGVGNGDLNSWQNNLNTSVGQFNYAMQFYKQNNKRKLILDLRDNGGGYLSILRCIASHFIHSSSTENPLVMYTKTKDGKVENYYSLKTKKLLYNFSNITILANKNTASASESLIGAMLEYDSPGIVRVVVENNNGVYTSYGKGVVQDTIVDRINGQAIKLTIAVSFWPVTNICIHGKGISKAISRYSSQIYESKNGETDIDALKYAIQFLNN